MSETLRLLEISTQDHDMQYEVSVKCEEARNLYAWKCSLVARIKC